MQHAHLGFQKPTHAILVATHELSLDTPIMAERYPAVLLPLMDRPFLQHLLEHLVRVGFRQFDLLISKHPEKIEHLLGDGKRWGISIRYHLIRDAQKPYPAVDRINTAAKPGSARILLAHATRWPAIDWRTITHMAGPSGLELFFAAAPPKKEGLTNSSEPVWSGWALLPPQCLVGLPDRMTEPELGNYLANLPATQKTVISESPMLSVHTMDDLFASHRHALQKQRTDVTWDGHEIEPGIWLARNVRLHPAARLTPPVYVGENSRVDKNAQLGPFGVVGPDCYIAGSAIVQESIVIKGSYVGENLELNQVLVDRNCLVNQRLGSEMVLTEDFLIGSLLKGPDILTGVRLLSRCAGFLLFLLFSPGLAMYWLNSRLYRRKPVFGHRAFIQLPALPDPVDWRTQNQLYIHRKDRSGPEALATPGWSDLLYRIIPGLINVAAGHLGFVGVAPRSSEQIKRLPEDWRALYLKSKVGLISEAQVVFGPAASEDQLYSAEAVYCVSHSMLYDLRILGRYLLQMMKRRPGSENRTVPETEFQLRPGPGVENNKSFHE